jgi:hypothetical protein
MVLPHGLNSAGTTTESSTIHRRCQSGALLANNIACVAASVGTTTNGPSVSASAPRHNTPPKVAPDQAW